MRKRSYPKNFELISPYASYFIASCASTDEDKVLQTIQDIGKGSFWSYHEIMEDDEEVKELLDVFDYISNLHQTNIKIKRELCYKASEILGGVLTWLFLTWLSLAPHVSKVLKADMGNFQKVMRRPFRSRKT